MARRSSWLAGLALALSCLSGCGLFCERYCEREQRRCEQYNRGGCAPAPACPPACAPAACAPAYYGGQPGYCQ